MRHVTIYMVWRRTWRRSLWQTPKARLCELVDRAQAGDSIDITRRGKPVARLTAATRPPKAVDPALLRSLTEAMPPQSQSAVVLVRSMRDGDRY